MKNHGENKAISTNTVKFSSSFSTIDSNLTSTSRSSTQINNVTTSFSYTSANLGTYIVEGITLKWKTTGNATFFSLITKINTRNIPETKIYFAFGISGDDKMV